MNDPFETVHMIRVEPENHRPPHRPGFTRAGIDVVDRTRLQRAILRSGDPFVNRVFGPEPVTAGLAERRAVVFGAKEAAIKAIGGLPTGGRFTDIDVVVEPDDASLDRGVVSAALTGATARPLPSLLLDGAYRHLEPEATLVWLFDHRSQPPDVGHGGGCA